MNFTFNVSHEGHYVVLASDPVLLVGIDVSAPFDVRADVKPMGEWSDVRSTFSNVLSADEWELVEERGSDTERVHAFRRAWSRKESFVKARGDGLAFELERAEFWPCRFPLAPAAAAAAAATDAAAAAAAAAAAVAAAAAAAATPAAARATADEDDPSRMGAPLATSASSWSLVRVDGETSIMWRCAGVELPDGHLIALTRGPVSQAVDERGAFRRTFGRPLLPLGELRARLAQPGPPFRRLAIRDLVPPALRAAYDATLDADAMPRSLQPPLPAYRPAEPPPEPEPTGGAGAREDGADGKGAPAWFHPANSASAGRDFADPFGLSFGAVPVKDGGTNGSAKELAEEEECVVS